MIDHLAILRPLTSNIGDDIQALAALELIRRHTKADVCVLDRDIPQSSNCHETHKLLINGWFYHEPFNFPSVENYPNSLILGIHITDRKKDETTYVLNSISNFNQPIGSRDIATHLLLRKSGINSYLTFCLSLTLNRLKTNDESNKAYFVDIDSRIKNIVQENFDFEINEDTSNIELNTSFANRNFKVEDILSKIANSKLVITSRLHIALPAVAIGIPVVCIQNGSSAKRFSGYENLITIIESEKISAKLLKSKIQEVLTSERQTHKRYAIAIEETVKKWLLNEPAQDFTNLASISDIFLNRHDNAMGKFSNLFKFRSF